MFNIVCPASPQWFWRVEHTWKVCERNEGARTPLAAILNIAVVY